MKLPLVSSESKAVRMAGWFFYAVVALVLLGLILPAPAQDKPLDAGEVWRIMDGHYIKNDAFVDGGNVVVSAEAKNAEDGAQVSRWIFRDLFKDSRIEKATVATFTYDANINREYGDRYTMTKDQAAQVSDWGWRLDMSNFKN